jgi:hypothetical protein
MSGLATVTYAPVSAVTWHDLSPIQPRMTRLGSALTVTTARDGLPYVYPGVRRFPRSSFRFPTFGHPSRPPLCCFSVVIRNFFPVPVVSLRYFVSFPTPIVFCLRSVGALVREVARLRVAPARRSSFVSSVGWGRWAPPECPGARILGPGC